MSQHKAKRFYKSVSVTREGDRYGVHLDGRTLKTPGKLTLAVEQEPVAELIAAEWDAQTDTIKPETMPVTRLVNVSLELTPDKRPDLVAEARSYAATDLLCYRDVSGSALSRHQAKAWNPILDWAETEGIRLTPTHSILAIDQDAAALDRIAKYAEGLGDLCLTLFVHLTSVFGSAVLGLAVMRKYLTGSHAFDLSRLDADWQIQHWGEDEEAKDNRDDVASEVIALCQILGD